MKDSILEFDDEYYGSDGCNLSICNKDDEVDFTFIVSKLRTALSLHYVDDDCCHVEVDFEFDDRCKKAFINFCKEVAYSTEEGKV